MQESDPRGQESMTVLGKLAKFVHDFIEKVIQHKDDNGQKMGQLVRFLRRTYLVKDKM